MPFILGPYYKYRTFEDLHDAEYSANADCKAAVISRLSTIPLYLAGFFVSEYLFPLDVRWAAVSHLHQMI